MLTLTATSPDKSGNGVVDGELGGGADDPTLISVSLSVPISPASLLRHHHIRTNERTNQPTNQKIYNLNTSLGDYCVCVYLVVSIFISSVLPPGASNARIHS
jgi:hypothetical protein